MNRLLGAILVYLWHIGLSRKYVIILENLVISWFQYNSIDELLLLYNNKLGC